MSTCARMSADRYTESDLAGWPSLNERFRRMDGLSWLVVKHGVRLWLTAAASPPPAVKDGALPLKRETENSGEARVGCADAHSTSIQIRTSADWSLFRSVEVRVKYLI